MFKKKPVAGLILVLLLATSVLAHQPVIVGKETITIEKPEISRAFYGELAGLPRAYFIKAAQPFDLYVNLLVPRNTNAGGRYSARIDRLVDGQRDLLIDLRADSVVWQEFYEPFGRDYYLKGPEYKNRVPAGDYEIEVYSSDNKGKYVLAVGEKEFFGPKEIAGVYTELPKLKTDFFGDNPVSFFTTPFGVVLVIIAGVAVLYLIRR
jgi:hypothetical protein